MAAAFVVQYTGDVAPLSLLRWGRKNCSELFLSAEKKVLSGVWKAVPQVREWVVRNRLRGNLRSWGIDAEKIEFLDDVEKYRCDALDVLALEPPSAPRAPTVSEVATGSVGAAFLFDPSRKLLSIGGEPARVFEDSKGNAWFQAKPIVVFLEYGETNVHQTLERLDPEDVESLDSLQTKNPKIFGQITQNFSHNELKTLYINEPGVYDLILGSQKEEARSFKRWVTHEVLPALRRAEQPIVDVAAAVEKAVSEALDRRHGVLEISGSRGASKTQQELLLRIGTKVNDSTLREIAAEGGPLHVSSFLIERGVEPELVRRVTPTFAREANRRKLVEHDAGREGPIWIAWSQGDWRLYYTEADRDVLQEVWEDPLTQQNIATLRGNTQSRRARGAPERRRSGPYNRPLLRSSSGAVVTQSDIQRFFGAS